MSRSPRSGLSTLAVASRALACGRACADAEGPQRSGPINRPCQRQWVKPIELIDIGDRIWSWCAAEGVIVANRVVRLFRQRQKPIVEIDLSRNGRTTETISATLAHPFWVASRGWVAAGEVLPGDRLKPICDKDPDIRVVAVRRCAQTATVFNVEVERAHNYFAGRLGVLVHNQSDRARASVPADDANPPFTGAVIGHTNYVPPGGSRAERFLADSLTNRRFDTPSHVERSAIAFDAFRPIEAAIDVRTGRELQSGDSSFPAVRQHEYIIDQVRQFWRRQLFADDSPALRETAASWLQGRIHPETLGVLRDHMSQRGTPERGAHPSAFELLTATKLVLERFGQQTPEIVRFIAREKAERIQADRGNTHAARTVGGVDLRSDPGTLLAESYGLPVMSGTSGTTSSVVRMLLYVAERNGSSWRAPELSHGLAVQAMFDLGIHYMGSQVIAPALSRQINALRVQQGAAAKQVEPFMVTTHAACEIEVVIDRLLNGRSLEHAYQHAALRRIDARWTWPGP